MKFIGWFVGMLIGMGVSVTIVYMFELSSGWELPVGLLCGFTFSSTGMLWGDYIKKKSQEKVWMEWLCNDK